MGHFSHFFVNIFRLFIFSSLVRNGQAGNFHRNRDSKYTIYLIYWVPKTPAPPIKYMCFVTLRKHTLNLVGNLYSWMSTDPYKIPSIRHKS